MNVKNIVASHEADYNLEFTYGYDSVYNDEQIIATIEEVVKKEMGAEYILHVPPFMGERISLLTYQKHQEYFLELELVLKMKL